MFKENPDKLETMYQRLGIDDVNSMKSKMKSYHAPFSSKEKSNPV